MSFWGGAFAKSESAYQGTTCTEVGSHWRVTEVIDGVATVVVRFHHECRRPMGVTYPPSNNRDYEYEAPVESTTIRGARKEIESKLGPNYNVAQLLDLLTPMW